MNVVKIWSDGHYEKKSNPAFSSYRLLKGTFYEEIGN